MKLHEQDLKNLDGRFAYYAPKEDQAERYEKIRAAIKECAKICLELTPYSREQSLGMTHLDSAMFFFNASIARNE